MENNPDNITVGKVLGGDAEAYREIIGRHGGQVFALVSGIVRNRQDACCWTFSTCRICP